MERRNRSIEALNRLQYLDSLESESRANGLLEWVNEYITDTQIEDFDLQHQELMRLEELFYRNISFMKKYRSELKVDLDSNHKIRAFLD
jgi:predicted DNA-binding protein